MVAPPVASTAVPLSSLGPLESPSMNITDSNPQSTPLVTIPSIKHRSECTFGNAGFYCVCVFFLGKNWTRLQW